MVKFISYIYFIVWMKLFLRSHLCLFAQFDKSIIGAKCNKSI